MSVIHGVVCNRCGEVIIWEVNQNSGYVVARAKENGCKGGYRITDEHFCPDCVDAGFHKDKKS